MGGGPRTTTATRLGPVSPAATPLFPAGDAPRRAAVVTAATVAAGTVAAAMVAVGGTALGTTRRGVLAGLVSRGVSHAHPLLLPRLATSAAVVLVGCWLAVVVLAARGRVGGRAIALTSAVWGLPLAVGAPLLSADAYAYLADGRLLMTGHDPYRVGAAVLGPGSPWLAPVDPQWAHARAPYGPAALLLSRAAAATGSVGAGVAVLVAVAVLSVALTGWMVWSLAPAAHRAVALALWLPAPPVLLHLVGGAHLDALMVALLVGGLWALRRGHPLPAAALVGLATAVKAPAAVAVVVVATAALPPGRTAAVLASARRLAAAAAAYLVPALVLGDPWRLAATLGGPARAQTLAAPSTLVAKALGGHGLTAVRIAALVVAGAVAVVLVVTARRRRPEATVGWSLLAVVVASPVFYPWYLTWPLACIAAASAARGRRWLVALVALTALPALPGLAGLSAPGVAIVAVVVAGLAIAAWRCGEIVARQP